MADAGSPTNDWVKKAVFECPDPRVIHPNAVNFLVIDGYNEEKQFDDWTSYGFYGYGAAGLMCAVLIDVSRLVHIFAAEEHEMGHVFGLGHFCDPAATGSSPTNIMTQRNACKGGIGKEGSRAIGFNKEQEESILKKAGGILPVLKAQVPATSLRNAGFEEKAPCYWAQHCSVTSNAHSGKYAAWIENKEIKQIIFSEEEGVFTLSAYVNAHGLDGVMGVRINGQDIKEIPLSANGGYNKNFDKVSISNIRLTGNDIVEITFCAGKSKIWVDDVSFTKENKPQ